MWLKSIREKRLCSWKASCRSCSKRERAERVNNAKLRRKVKRKQEMLEKTLADHQPAEPPPKMDVSLQEEQKPASSSESQQEVLSVQQEEGEEEVDTTAFDEAVEIVRSIQSLAASGHKGRRKLKRTLQRLVAAETKSEAEVDDQTFLEQTIDELGVIGWQKPADGGVAKAPSKAETATAAKSSVREPCHSLFIGQLDFACTAAADLENEGSSALLSACSWTTRTTHVFSLPFLLDKVSCLNLTTR